ncbi:ABC-type glutathione transport system ATPase component [Actinoalloteichus hoggarensis]|uniref:Oligopeptide transport ATP-binding protein OppD n=1 Tax=Actinoalloteichus hoggarensis TaxID=1470176 RepID=A0A221W864_9PSEU|nr:ABC transporter ATP-binding protein [Actinoalloteichus hoggarensis]ASO21719.1 Oligopeptide transport ATP-binding protein OppD [Actinoalloteichus hoggarensis]MBB5922315.1 ABC-type glutathione transport system ATPase component [Actinoalloteichus hoggarensis]
MRLLEVRGLTVRRRDGTELIAGVDLDLAAGERLGIVGESGSGKSLTALAVAGLLPEGMTVSGSVRLDGVELLGLPEREMTRVRGAGVAMVFQEPLTALDPLMRVGRQIAGPLRGHRGLGRREAEAEAVELCRRVRLPDPAESARAYPHQLSGGQRQRVALAVALACRPRLLIADEPTTALDVTVQAEILELITESVASEGAGLLFISHDLPVIASVGDRIAVMRDGAVVEQGEVEPVLAAPRHPYTRELLTSAVAAGRLPGDPGWEAG